MRSLIWTSTCHLDEWQIKTWTTSNGNWQPSEKRTLLTCTKPSAAIWALPKTRINLSSSVRISSPKQRTGASTCLTATLGSSQLEFWLDSLWCSTIKWPLMISVSMNLETMESQLLPKRFLGRAISFTWISIWTTSSGRVSSTLLKPSASTTR